MGSVPTFLVFAVGLFQGGGPFAEGQGFQSHAGHAFGFGFGQDLRAKIAVFPRIDVHGKQDAVEFERVDQTKRGGRIVSRKPEMESFPFFFGGEEGFGSSAGGEDLVHIVHRGDGMKLVEVDVIGMETLESLFQFRASARGIAVGGFLSKEDFIAIGAERFAELAFSFAIEIRGGAVEIVQTAVIGLCDAAGSLFLGHATNDNSAHSQDGKLDAVFVRALG
jgi:hypothetical protein